ncbi:MAG: hypothetical protein JWO33_2063 [Caulobacteraceae bacterium]|nr:hypothetical protein [Caulobacteraceae bacterium]
MRFVFLAVWLVCIAGPACAEKLDIEVPAPIVVTPLPSSADPQPVSLAKAVVDMREGEAWLDLRGTLLCIPQKSDGWQATSPVLDTQTRLGPIFDSELGAAGFKVGEKDSRDLFGSSSRTVDIQVGARISSIRAKACVFDADNVVFGRVSAVMDVEWQIFSVSQNRMLARIPTRGGHSDKGDPARAMRNSLEGSFAENVRALAMSDQFRTLLTSPVGPALSATPTGPLQISMPRNGVTHLADAAKGVVSIFAGPALGSGLLISTDGYILTNHHVAGDSGRVRIRWPDKSETVGEVVRADSRRDVALVKTTAKAAPLSIRHTPVELGETVYAIGTPLDPNLSGTLTRGVVSNTQRKVAGLSYIQSDVAVDHGNSGGPLLDDAGQVIGITQSGYAPDGVSHNINFFIPIEEALKALSLTPAP